MTQQNTDVGENFLAKVYKNLFSAGKPKNSIDVENKASTKQSISTDNLIFGITPNTIFNFDADFSDTSLTRQKTIFSASNEKPVKNLGLNFKKTNQTLFTTSEIPPESGKNFDQIG